MAKFHCLFCHKKAKAKEYENRNQVWLKVQVSGKEGTFDFISCPDHVDALRLVVFNFLEDPSLETYQDAERLGHPIEEKFSKRHQPEL
jgi:hypothetical protein